jgi:hypothetical protein
LSSCVGVGRIRVWVGLILRVRVGVGVILRVRIWIIANATGVIATGVTAAGVIATGVTATGVTATGVIAKGIDGSMLLRLRLPRDGARGFHRLYRTHRTHRTHLRVLLLRGRRIVSELAENIVRHASR